MDSLKSRIKTLDALIARYTSLLLVFPEADTLKDIKAGLEAQRAKLADQIGRI